MSSTPLSLAMQHMACFFGERPIDDLMNILDKAFTFHGPFFRADSAVEYIEALSNDPPKNVSFEMLRYYEDSDSACLVYRFHKGTIESVMAQTFEVTDGRIKSTHLIFDSKDFEN